MSPSRRRALRALRVVLACLALWLPARAASAAVGPVETIVMMASRGVDIAPANARCAGEADHAAASARISVTPVSHCAPTAARPVPTQRRIVSPPRYYIRHCALLC